jgi:thiamine-phosphate pyrophosphorylase
MMLEQAQALYSLAPTGVRWIMNDRADLCMAAGFTGVHLGQDDLSVAGARKVVGAERLIGISTHNMEQFREAMATDADYLAMGPVFATQSKHNPDPVIGLENVRAARAITDRPLVAIGGITRENARSVLDAGADVVAVISDLLEPPAAGGHWLEATRKRVEAFLRVLG